MAVRQPDPGRGRWSALADEAYDLAWWLGLEPGPAAAVVGDAIYEVGGTGWGDARELEVALLATVAARALDGQGPARLLSPPHLSGRAFHPSATALAPAGSVDGLSGTAREALALLPPDDAAVGVLSIRFGVVDAELAALLGVTRRRGSDLAGRATAGFRAVAAAVLLWRGGAPTCAALEDLVELTGIADLRQGAGLVVGHAERCRTCRTALWRVTEVSAALATAPLVTVPPGVARDLGARLQPLLAEDRRPIGHSTGPGKGRGPDAAASTSPIAGLAPPVATSGTLPGAGRMLSTRIVWALVAVIAVVAAVVVIVGLVF